MDWINHSAGFTDHDFEVFEYDSGHQSHAVIISKTNIDEVGQPYPNDAEYFADHELQYPAREILPEDNVNHDGTGTEEKSEEKVWAKGPTSLITCAHAKQPPATFAGITDSP